MSVIRNVNDISVEKYMDIPFNYNTVVFEELRELLSVSQTPDETISDSVITSEPVDTEQIGLTDLPQIQRIVDSAVHLLGSKQDIVHTVHRILEDREEWDLAVMDGHGSSFEMNPYTGKYEKFNFTLSVINEMILNGKLDEIMARDIYSSDDPAIEFQRYLSQKCRDFKRDMTNVGTTFSLIQIRHDFNTKKITVHVLTVGDSPVTIHLNGEKVLESVDHDWRNSKEMDRLRREKRLNPVEISRSNTFKFLDEKTLVAEITYYINAKKCNLAMTQSIGHIEYTFRDGVTDEKGIFGLDPFKATMVFDETDELNIKGYSDGVSDIVVNYIPIDSEFLSSSNATETADLAKMRWEKTWDSVSKIEYEKALKEGKTLEDVKKKEFAFGYNADDVCCVSWIQKKV